MKNVSYSTPKIQNKQFVVTDIYLEDRKIDFSGKLSNGIHPAINFEFVKWIVKNINSQNMVKIQKETDFFERETGNS